MMLNGGIYGGKQYFQPSTIDMFTSRQSDISRRGLGFDRWDPDPANRYPSELASPQTYGHTGFTGTCVWVDPKSKLIYIFLSNRLYQQPANKLSSLRVRPKIQDAIYQAINKAVL
jgi:CubicO group peptidase (beta-lactamase class C family)